MGKTNIEYCDEVSNPIYARLKGDETSKIGTFCEKPDAEGTCQNCWAETINLRWGNKLTFNKSNRDKIEWKFREKEFNRMRRLNAKKPMSGKFTGLPLVVFCFDTFDIFQPSISDEMRDLVFDNYDRFTNLILLVQTTYPAKMHNYFKARCGQENLPSHYWIGISAGTQEFFDANIHYLKNTRAKEKYVIFEPLLEKIKFDVPQMIYDWTTNKTPQFTFAIIGGESGGSARPCNIGWIRSIVWECREVGIKPFVKQLGGNPLIYRVGIGTVPYQTKAAKGGKIEEFPKDLQIREMPV